MCIIAHLRHVFFVLENPGSTLIYHVDAMRELLQWAGGFKIRTYMGQFN